MQHSTTKLSFKNPTKAHHLTAVIYKLPPTLKKIHDLTTKQSFKDQPVTQKYYMQHKTASLN